ncbi:hypothetical protein BGZ80_004546 [Entomortierella chlamydospora]|uniref:Uncharacterized protein n=1 Tax=Entomortierella chlamydospora TaxID=101097 RepID=A0A9P6MN92_9FUNG|nr:hypothetical protein BGZ80_004546 [Entomortierella chlamydospora]
MTLVAIWAFLRRRKSHPSKTSPSISPKGRDLEQQLNLYYNDNNNREDNSSGNAPKHSFYSLRRNNSHASKKHSTQQSSTNVTNTQATTPTPAVPLARDPTQPRSHSVHNLNITPTSTHKQAHRRQLSVPSATILLPSSTPPVPPLPPVPSIPSDAAKVERKSTVAKPLVQECQQPIDCHIDMVNVDVESLMPIIMTDELELQQPNNIPIQSQQQTPQQQTPKQQNQQDQQQQDVNSNAKDSNIPPAPIVSSTPTMPTPTPRPSLAGRKSTDGGRNRISMSFLPPTPPPSVPPPAVPMTYPGGITEARGRTSAEASTHAIIARGRKPRTSMDSISSAGRRSISLDSSHREGHAQEMAARSKANNSPSGGYAHRTSKKIILPPPTPPPTSAMTKLQQQQKQAPMHARRQHQRNPSQILSTGFFASPDRSPLSPLSPPHSPLTIQIPRNMPPRSNSALASYATPTIQNRPDSPTIGSNNPSPSQSVQFQQLPSTMRTKAQSQNKRIRSKSVTQTEHHRVITPSSASGHCVGPRSPAHLSDHLPPFPPVHSHLLHIRRPSQPQQQQQWLLNQQALSSGWEESSRPSTSTPTASASASVSTARDDEEREHELLQQRPTSFDSWMQQSYPASPATPTAPESLTGSENHYSVIRGSIEKDLELQAIIANARRIAAEKIAAMEEARRLSYSSNSSNRHQQHQFQYHQGQRFARPTSSASSSRPRTPSDENWDPSRPSFDDGFESEASSYMTTTRSARATPSPSHG